MLAGGLFISKEQQASQSFSSIFFSFSFWLTMDKSTGHDIEEDNIASLYEASHEGCESALNSLMQRDALILNKISLTSFTDTPLHIAVLHGHQQFTSALLKNKPNLADRKDLRGRTALHLASAEGHSEIVTELLKADSNVCLARDQDGRIPLHLAVMRGHIEVIEKLLNSKPNSILEDLDGASVLHLCVKYNCLDALKLLVKSADEDGNFVNSKDNDGNSILHLAVMLGQTETIEYLLSIPELKRKANAINMIANMTALDVSETLHIRDFKCLKIQDILKAAGVRRSKDLNPLLLHDAQAQSAQSIIEEKQALSRFGKWWRYFYSCRWVKHLQSQDNWIDETRGTLMLVATVIATVTFQGGINPPGGVWQSNSDNSTVAGTAIFLSNYYYKIFLNSNTISFVAALSILLVVICGFPSRNKFFIWFLTLTMFIAIYAMAVTYFAAVQLVSNEIKLLEGNAVLYILSVTFIVAVAIHIIRLLFWIAKLLLKFKRWLTKQPANDAINI